MREAVLRKEQRRHERFTPAWQPSQGLYLYVGDQRIDVHTIWGISPFQTVQDISPSGVGLQVDYAIDKGTMVRLMYESAELQVQGTIVSCTEFKDASNNNDLALAYRVGISLEPEDAEENAKFFRYMTGR